MYKVVPISLNPDWKPVSADVGGHVMYTYEAPKLFPKHSEIAARVAEILNQPDVQHLISFKFNIDPILVDLRDFDRCHSLELPTNRPIPELANLQQLYVTYIEDIGQLAGIRTPVLQVMEEEFSPGFKHIVYSEYVKNELEIGDLQYLPNLKPGFTLLVSMDDPIPPIAYEAGCYTGSADLVAGFNKLFKAMLDDCHTLSELNMSQLVCLEMGGEIDELPALPDSLIKLNVHECRNLTRLPANRITELECSPRLVFTDAPLVEKLTITGDAYNKEYLSTSPFDSLSKLQSLNLFGVALLTDGEPVNRFNVADLEIAHCSVTDPIVTSATNINVHSCDCLDQTIDITSDGPDVIMRVDNFNFRIIAPGLTSFTGGALVDLKQPIQHLDVWSMKLNFQDLNTSQLKSLTCAGLYTPSDVPTTLYQNLVTRVSQFPVLESLKIMIHINTLVVDRPMKNLGINDQIYWNSGSVGAVDIRADCGTVTVEAVTSVTIGPDVTIDQLTLTRSGIPEVGAGVRIQLLVIVQSQIKIDVDDPKVVALFACTDSLVVIETRMTHAVVNVQNTEFRKCTFD